MLQFNKYNFFNKYLFFNRIHVLYENEKPENKNLALK